MSGIYDVVQNPIPKSGLWMTPADLEHLTVLINECGSAEEQRMAWYGAMLALNLAHELVEDNILSKEIFAS
jgi:hypothetical protein